MLEKRHQGQVQQLRDHQHHHRDLHRRADVLAGVKARRQHLDRHQPDQAGAVTHERRGGLIHIPVGEGAVVVERGDQRLGKGQQRHRTRHGQQHHDAQAPVQHGGILFGVVGGFGRRQLRHQHHADRHPQHGGRELHQAVRVSQPADAARRQVRGNLRVDQQRDLRHAHAQQGGHHEAGDVAGAGIGPGHADRRQAQAYPGQHADLQQGRDLHRQLQQTTQHHAGAHGVNRLNALRLEPGRAQPGGAYHGQVQQNRCGGRHGEAFPGVQDAGRQGHQRHEADIGKHPARHENGGFKAPRILFQAAGHHPDQHRRRRHTDHAGQQQRPGQQGRDAVYQQFGISFTISGMAGRQHRHKGLAERALGKQSPEQVGDAESDVERVGHGAGAEGGSHQQLAHQAGDPRHQGQQGNGGGGFEK